MPNAEMTRTPMRGSNTSIIVREAIVLRYGGRDSGTIPAGDYVWRWHSTRAGAVSLLDMNGDVGWLPAEEYDRLIGNTTLRITSRWLSMDAARNSVPDSPTYTNAVNRAGRPEAGDALERLR